MLSLNELQDRPTHYDVSVVVVTFRDRLTVLVTLRWITFYRLWGSMR